MIEIKDFNEYQTHALRTLAPGYSKSINVMHSVMGMVGEIGELLEHSIPTWDAKNDPRVGEVGDCLWYCAVLANELGIPFQTVVNEAYTLYSGLSEFPGLPADARAAIYAARLMELVKKEYFYQKTPDPSELSKNLTWYVAELQSIATFIGVKLLTAAEINVNKLAKRFPDKFDADKAINRDYEAESNAAGVKIS